jgi:murein DD-endopeptidase MepM/ murein hydrolase activator NlpD
MRSDWDRRVRTGCALLACVCAGALGDGLLRMKYIRTEPGVRNVTAVEPTIGANGPTARPTGASPRVPAPGGAEVKPGRPNDTPAATTGAVSSGALRMPVDGAAVEALKGGFEERRGNRPHEAIDILAPRNTPVRAVEGGTIAKLFESKAGGLTVYQFDPSGSLAYYYAHLEKYADGIHEGQAVSQGEIIGYVGTSGNAPPNTPHLHFAVFQLDETRRWWKGKAIDPYLVFKNRG